MPDINLRLYAYDSDSLFQDRAAGWWKKCLSGTESIGLPAVVVCGFFRVGTNARASRKPMSPAEGAECARLACATNGAAH